MARRGTGSERASYHQYFSSAATRAHGFTGRRPAPAAAAASGDEFDESEIWGSFNSAAETEQQPRAGAEIPRRPGRKTTATKPGAAHGSLPVNIPDWSKILGDEYRGHQEWELDDADDEDIEGGGASSAVVPPHELAWRRRAASLSVHGHQDGMGIGRTLKVRDAVWKKTGFQA